MQNYVTNSALNFLRANEDAIFPTRGSEGSVGYDLYAPLDMSNSGHVYIEPNLRMLVLTGIHVKMPPFCYGRIAPRSGLAWNDNIWINAGVIDPDYTGQIGVIMHNAGPEPFKVRSGAKIAQLILEQCLNPFVREVNREQFDAMHASSERGSAGYGSTG